MSKFDAKYFDEDFYQAKTQTKGFHRRDENCANYIEYARRFNDCFKDTDCKTVLDIGAGIGVRTTNHINNGYDAHPCDVSRWAFEHSVLPNKAYCVDVRDMSSIDRTFDIVNVERILGYIPPEDSLLALQEINNKATKYIVFSIICSDHKDQEGVVEVAKVGRINLQPKAFWEELFAVFDWTLDQEKTDIMLQNGWDCIYVYKVNK